MRGLTDLERMILEKTTRGCRCGPGGVMSGREMTDEEDRAARELVRRGALVLLPCGYVLEATHAFRTPLGSLALAADTLSRTRIDI